MFRAWGASRSVKDNAADRSPPRDSRYFFTVHVIVFSSQVPAALSQSALVFGASCAKAGAETANRRPAMSAKLTVFICVSSYLLEHLKMPAVRTLHWGGRSVFKRSPALPFCSPCVTRVGWPKPSASATHLRAFENGCRVVSSDGLRIYSLDGIAR